MDEPKNIEHVEKIRDLVTIDIEHELEESELKTIGMQLALLYGEVEQAEIRKKNVASQHKNTIDALKVEAKKLSSYISTGFRTEPRVAELYLDFQLQKRLYYDKRTGDLLMEKDFEESDYQKKLNFYNKQEQIEQNNTAGDYAEGGDALDQVINEKKNLKPDPKNNLPDDYGKNHEYQEENLPPVVDQDLFHPSKDDDALPDA